MCAIAQITSTAASASCTCDGSISYSPIGAINQTYQLISLSDGSVSNFSSNNGFIQTNLCAGSYSLQIQSNGALDTLYVTIPLIGNPFPVHSELAVCTSTSTINLNTALSGLPLGGTWFDPNGMITGTNLNTATASEGFYSYSIIISGCAIVTGVLLEINTAPNTGNQTTTLICDTWAPFDMLIYMQGAPDAGGQWYTTQGTAMDGIFDPATMASQLFTYMIDDVPGCAPTYTTMFIQENATPNAGLPSSVFVCANGTPFNMLSFIEGNPSGGGTWTNPINSPVSNTFTPGVSMPGIYTYNINALTPCIDQEVTLTVDVTNTDPSGDVSNISLCSNTPGFDMLTVLDGSPIAGGTWTNNAGVVIDGNFTVQDPGAGIYHYYYPNVGCSPQGASLTITIETLGSAGNNYTGTICSSSGTLNLSALLSPGSTMNGTWYTASNQIISPIIALNALAEQQYTYFIDGTVCPDDYSFFDIHVDDPPPVLTDISIAVCSTSPPIDLLTNYPGIANMQFFDATNTPMSPSFDPSGSSSSIYYVEIPSGNICLSSTSILDIEVENPILLTPIVVDICENTTSINLAELAPTFAQGPGMWFDSFDNSVNIQTPWNASLLDYYFIPSDFQACPIDTGFLTIQVSSYQASTSLPGLTICSLDPLLNLMDLIPLGWSANGDWSLNNNILSPPTLLPASAANGQYIYTIPGQGTCPEAELTQPITFVSPPVYDLGPNLNFCANQNQILLGNINNIYAFDWNPSIYLDDPSADTPLLTVDPIDNQVTILIYTVNISNGYCHVMDTLQITFYPQPQIELLDQYSLCLGDQLTLSLPFENQYSWAPANSFSNPSSNIQTIQPTGFAQIQVNAENAWGCENNFTFAIDVNSNPIFEVDAIPLAGCYSIADTLHANGVGHYDYDWIFQETISQGDSLSIEVTEPGLFDLQVTATDSIGCQTTQTFASYFELFPSPTALFETNPTEVTIVNNQIQMINLTTDGDQFTWQIDSSINSTEYAPTFILPTVEPTNFEICLIAVNSFGCIDTTCRFVHMDNEHQLWAPNAFTPDADQINDVFAITMTGFDPSTYRLIIYDRWGSEVFESSDPNEVWQGNHQKGGYYCQPDVYPWVIEVKDAETAIYETFHGHITLIR